MTEDDGLSAISTDEHVTVHVRTAHGPADDTRVDAWELAAARRGMTNLRRLLYGAPMQALLADQIAESDRRAHEYAAASAGAFTECHVEVSASGVHIAELLAGIQSMLGGAAADEEERKAMVLATGFPTHPEHYMVLPGAGVVETMGGLPTLTRIAPIETPPDFVAAHMDESYPVRRAGQGPLDDGTPFTYVLQQFRDTPEGLEASLRVWYPAACPPVYVEEHAEHFAVETRNLLRLVAATRAA